MAEPTHDEKVKKLAELIEAVKVGMLTTTDTQSGRLHSRPMNTQGGLDGDSVFFFTYQDANKVDEFKEDRQVNVAYADATKSRYVSLAGFAKLVTDRKLMERKWDPSLNAWFADGLDTPGIALIQVRATEVQYWDAPNQTMLHLYGVAKAKLTGEPVHDAGENEVVTLG